MNSVYNHNKGYTSYSLKWSTKVLNTELLLSSNNQRVVRERYKVIPGMDGYSVDSGEERNCPQMYGEIQEVVDFSGAVWAGSEIIILLLHVSSTRTASIGFLRTVPAWNLPNRIARVQYVASVY